MHNNNIVYELTKYYMGQFENDNSHLYIKCYINASRLNRYIFRTVNAINILFSTLHTTPFLYGKILFGILHLLLASIATFDTPTGFKPAITFCRSNQIASNSVCRWRGPIPIDLFCSLIFMPSVTEKLRARFPA